MAQDDGEHQRHDPLTRTERRRLGQILGVAEVMTALMVFATILSAIATWRTANIAEWIYLASERRTSASNRYGSTTPRPARRA